MSSILNSAGSSLGTFGSQIVKCANEVSKYDRQIGALEERIRKYDNLKSRGLQDIQNGMIMSVPVEEALRYAGTFETVMTKVNNAIYDSTVPLTMQQQIMKKLEKQAIELGNATTFSNVQAAEAQLALIRNGMTYRDVLNGGATAAMFLAQTAEIAPSTAADAVSQITNMFQLQGRQLLKVADDINRAANASSAGVTNLMHDLQQTGLSAHTLGLQVKETALMLGTLHNMGLGDASGTYLNDMLINLDKVTPKARSAMQAMGWLEGATVKTLSSGRIKVTGGTNSLFDEQGRYEVPSCW
jgi:TP901 family phage tail tape measure protein